MTRFLSTFLIALFMMAPSAQAQDFTDAQREEINKMIAEYLLNNGEQVLESVNRYQGQLEEEQREESSVKAKEFLDTLDEKNNLPMAGNPDGDITIVEFFDYNCGYCRKALDEIQTVLKDDDEVKVIFMDMPILGPSSIESAKWSLAAAKQGKYFAYHQELLSHNGQKNDKVYKDLAKKVGLNVKQLEKDKAADEINDMVDANLAASRDLGIRGTPGFIVAGSVYPGYMPADQIKEIIAEARKAE